jgi:hypothetical protein
MNKLKLFKLKLSILLRKSMLNKILNILPLNSKIVISLSQNLDKHIAAYQKQIHNIYNLELLTTEFDL